ncbi:MAG: hypothetical protein SFU86_16990 [Pirellulaceae bacterium]|nr:hypothetical protein [Pirellulaceae bacterium]
MHDTDVGDWVLFGGAAFIALTSLVIIMLRRRDEVLTELTREAHSERERKKQAELAEKRKAKKSKRAA